MLTALMRFLRDESGSNAVEYAILGTLIAVAIAGSVVAVGNEVGAVFGHGTGGPSDIMGNAADGL